MKKKFIITIDTEGDDLWTNKITRNGLKEITTENAKIWSVFNYCVKNTVLYQFI